MAHPANPPSNRHPRQPKVAPATGAAVDPARDALAWAHTARFVTTAAQLHQLPATELPEVAFVGRSNAGKSTAINTLAQQRQLAFASKTPGRTQHINLFALGPRELPDLLWADLPGYGYAAVEREAKRRWQEVMTHYLEVRRNLAGVVQMVDSRHGFTDLDEQLLSFVAPRVRTGEVKLLVLLTKADKLNRKEQAESLRKAQGVLASVVTDEADVGICLFSSLNKTGVGDVAQVLRDWAQGIAAQRVALGLPPAVLPGPDTDDEPPLD
ncbi:YihA family ribosome biogenesis GTP-binding protein [Aquabacterium fontiphilum]|uniref:ribosome biogenesis GTP-binding protein YihA/YsxC n=1 Tax=Aquabacterium fontiphilum TaxID=450365 RepID=UPI0013788DAD|nr:ribosome biogenesis GTP-binding protein YihA/YsxC [Aquabacterium fontiphilum]NBD21098.1 YihA family ribosome biogenesis GTP-binding protein [Aquabacterium fontiphilum]